MPNKTFYQAAADELARGHRDEALWTMVATDNPDAGDTVVRARYIQERARELERESLKASVGAAARTGAKRLAVVAVLAAFGLAFIVAFIAYRNELDRAEYAATFHKAIADANAAVASKDVAAYYEKLQIIDRFCGNYGWRASAPGEDRAYDVCPSERRLAMAWDEWDRMRRSRDYSANTSDVILTQKPMLPDAPPMQRFGTSPQ